MGKHQAVRVTTYIYRAVWGFIQFRSCKPVDYFFVIRVGIFHVPRTVFIPLFRCSRDIGPAPNFSAVPLGGKATKCLCLTAALNGHTEGAETKASVTTAPAILSCNLLY